MREALFWEKAGEGRVRCGLCRFFCLIPPGHRGRCGVRENRDGTLYTLVYGKSVAEHVDPIEKKPLFHVLPGSLTYSLATIGCNFRCLHCQNAEISQWPHDRPGIPGDERSPQALVAAASASGCRSIAYTYTEPTIYFEYAFDIARLAREAGLKNLFVTNGYISAPALEMVAPYLDAANIDLKGFSETFYRDVTGASLAGVLDCLRDYRRLGIWIEVTTLVIPGLNDSDADLSGIAGFIAGELGPEVPWHLSAFRPTYRMLDRQPTSADALRRAAEIGRKAGLQYVYLGNLAGGTGEETVCPACGTIVIRRRGFHLCATELNADGSCRACGRIIAGIGLSDRVCGKPVQGV